VSTRKGFPSPSGSVTRADLAALEIHGNQAEEGASKMITEFKIICDTEAMTVTLEIAQKGRLIGISTHETVTDCLYQLGWTIGRVMEARKPPQWDD